MKSLPLLILLAIGVHASAQQTIKPAFGKVEKADLQLKECDFDKNAEAMVLFDVCEVYCDFNPNTLADNPLTTQLERHVRIKILTDKGLSRVDIHIPYYSYRGLEKVRT